jgi:transposase
MSGEGGAAHQSVVGTGDRGRDPSTRHHRYDLTSACGTPAQKGDLYPHRIRYWLTPVHEETFDAKVEDICTLYREAPRLAEQGERVMSTDELTNVQALERKAPNLPLAPGMVERREFEYVRHGTRGFTINRDVVTGVIIAPSDGATRTEQDFLAHIQRLVATDPTATRWHIVLDNLNIHRSASLVQFVAADSGLEIDLGKKGTSGILARQTSRAAFLSDPTHRIVFHYTPKHASWMNQVELWLSILVRKLLQRASFSSVEALTTTVHEFIDYYNRTMAKPFKWTYQGKVLTT